MSRQRNLLLLILLLGAGLRFHALARDARLHPDEALYSTSARDAALKGDWSLQRPLDKPPLSFYAAALSMSLVGAALNDLGVLDFATVQIGEFAARLPNTLASILSIALVYALAAKWYEEANTALLAALLAALSPFALAFSATAFTDVLMSFWILAALWLVSLNYWSWAGLCLAVGLACKQPALFYLPLIILIGGLLHGFRARGVLRFTLLFLFGISLLVLWDSSRGQATIWEVSAGRQNYPTQLITLPQVLPRLLLWLDYGQWLVGPGGITALLLLLGGVVGIARFRTNPHLQVHQLDFILVIYILGFIGLHWWVMFNIFDRYLLPLVPLCALLAAHGVNSLLNALPTRLSLLRKLAALLLVTGLGHSAWNASEGRIPIGGDQGQHDGIDLLAEYLNSKPVATVIYDRWLGWELEYYLGPWSDKRKVYYPTPELLAVGALALEESGTRYFPAPVEQATEDWLEALRGVGFKAELVFTLPRFHVYALTPPYAAGASNAE